MVSLFLAIVSSSSIAWLFKITEGGSYNRYRVTTANYGVAFFVSLLFYVTGRQTQTDGQFLAKVDWPSVLGIGIPAGVCFFLSFVSYQISVKENGASLSGMFGKLGILLPMLMAIFIWQEIPTLIQFAGILLAFGAMVYVNYSPSDVKGHGFKRSLLFLFLAGGLAEFSSKLFQKLGQADDKHLFLFIVFLTAFCLSLYKTRRADKVDGSNPKKDYLMGALVGIPNLLSSVFLISALNEIPATIAFPIYSAGAIALITLGSYFFFGEAIGFKARRGLILTMIAMVLVNI